MDAVIGATNPVHALGFVSATTATTMGIALIRLLRSSDDQDGPEPSDPATAAAVPVHAVTDPAPEHEAQVLTDLTLIANTVRVQVQPDGTVTVAGIPDTVPADLLLRDGPTGPSCRGAGLCPLLG